MRAPSYLRHGLVLLALCSASAASAQKLSLGERVTRLEQQSAAEAGAAGQANVELLNRLTQMQGEVQALRNQVEQLQNENAQLKEQGKNQYLDLDGRLQRLEAAPAASAAAAPAASAVNTVAPGPARPVAGLAAAANNAAGEQAAYDGALAALRKGDYVTSSRGFQAYLRDYPDGMLAPNAWYWLGESYYATQNFPVALQSFETLLAQFPDSPKAADAMLKKGYCQIEMGQTGPGRQTLNRVVNEFPGSDAARVAASRLRGLALDAR